MSQSSLSEKHPYDDVKGDIKDVNGHHHATAEAKEVDEGAQLAIEGALDPAEARRVRCVVHSRGRITALTINLQAKDRSAHSASHVQYVFQKALSTSTERSPSLVLYWVQFMDKVRPQGLQQLLTSVRSNRSMHRQRSETRPSLVSRQLRI